MDDLTRILRALLLNVKMSESLESTIASVEILCTKEDIALVEKAIAEMKGNN